MLCDTLTIRVSPLEKNLLAMLAKHLERSQADTVRWLLRRAAQEQLPAEHPATPAPAAGQGASAKEKA